MTEMRPARRSVRLRLPDRPGALAEVTAVLAAGGIDIVRLEVWPEAAAEVYDDLTLEAPTLDQIMQAVRDLRGRGFEVATLPDHWWLRDWALEVFDAIDALDGAVTPGEELDIVLDVANRLANTSHAALVATTPGSDPVGHRIEELAGEFDPGWIQWSGSRDLVLGVQEALREARTGPPAVLKPVDAVHGLAVEIAGSTATPTILAVVGIRAPYLPAETTRLERYARLIGRLQTLESALASSVSA